MGRLNTTFQANLQFIVHISLEHSSEGSLEDRQEDCIDCGLAHPTFTPFSKVRTISSLNDQKLGLERDISSTRAHPLSHPPHLEPKSTHEPEVPAIRRHRLSTMNSPRRLHRNIRLLLYGKKMLSVKYKKKQRQE